MLSKFLLKIPKEDMRKNKTTTVLVMILLMLITLVVPVSATTFTSEPSGYKISVVVRKNEQGENLPVILERDDPDYQRYIGMIEPEFNIAAFKSPEGDIAFCIEPHQRFSNTTFQVHGWEYRSDWIASQEIYEKINLIAFHGFLKERQYTDDWKYWYAVTYATIYDEMLAVAVNDIDQYEASKQQILQEVEKHDVLPSFSKQNVILENQVPQTLTDTHQVMEDMSVIDDGGFDVQIVNQSLVIKVKANSPDKATIKLQKFGDIAYRDPVIYSNPKTQDVLVPALPHPLTTELSVEQVHPDTVDILKVDEDQQPIAGAIFQLSKTADFKEYVEVQSNAEGVIEALEFFGPNEKLYIKEVFVPKPYLLDPTVQEIVLSSGKHHRVQFTNKEVKGQLTIHKVDEEQQPLAGVEYELFDVNDQKIETLVTNEEGIATSSLLELGDYYVLEKVTPAGFIRDQSRHDFSIAYDQLEIIKISKSMMNYPQTGKLMLHKYGSQLVDFKAVETLGYTVYEPVFEDRYLAGAQFELRAAEDIHRNQRLLYKKDDIVMTFETTNKVTEITNLPLGKYELIETVSPDGYVLDTKIHHLHLQTSDDQQEVVVESIEQMNQRQQGLLKAIKSFDKSEYTAYPTNLQETTIFGLYTKEAFEQGDLKLEANSLVAVNQINADNYLELDVFFEGEYRLVELQSHPHYQRLLQPMDVSIVFEDQAFTTIELEPTLSNKLRKGQVALVKTDKQDPDKRLADTTFDLYRVLADNVKIGTYTTNEVGKIELELEFGEYYFVETIATPGYLKDDEKLTFTIDQDTQTLVLSRVNEQTTTLIEKRSEETEDFVEGAILQIFDDQNQLIEQWVSSDQPQVIRGLEQHATYTLVEKTAPAGYQVAKPITFTLNSDSQPTNIRLYNTALEIVVEILKTDEETNQPLANAKYELLDEQGILIQTLQTDDQGKVSFVVKKGRYFLRETQAPYGYLMDQEVKELVVTGLEPNQYLEVDFTNSKVSLPQTGPASVYIAMGIFGMGLVIVGYLFLRHRR